ncbi:hypothetical protein HYD_5380 [Candidatus Hydrogenosomobacter endosymbioticus]|uniref:Uncharacterized protein n=1 Tax=Candidatus Hydrogenosomobacter endosymbioticus TaxID=2558174 RepID=A0ABM7V9D0_9PROT|nr:hypothetical protein HYD_5380 [Candidatus Hydrogenosomobacter endosymbioticus]
MIDGMAHANIRKILFFEEIFDIPSCLLNHEYEKNVTTEAKKQTAVYILPQVFGLHHWKPIREMFAAMRLIANRSAASRKSLHGSGYC